MFNALTKKLNPKTEEGRLNWAGIIAAAVFITAFSLTVIRLETPDKTPVAQEESDTEPKAKSPEPVKFEDVTYKEPKPKPRAVDVNPPEPVDPPPAENDNSVISDPKPEPKPEPEEDPVQEVVKNLEEAVQTVVEIVENTINAL